MDNLDEIDSKTVILNFLNCNKAKVELTLAHIN